MAGHKNGSFTKGLKFGKSLGSKSKKKKTLTEREKLKKQEFLRQNLGAGALKRTSNAIEKRDAMLQRIIDGEGN